MESTEDGEDEKTVAVTAMQNVISHMSSVLKQARIDVDENVDEFVSRKIGKLFQVVATYSAAYKVLNVGTRVEFEQKIGSYFRDLEVQELFDDLLQNEKGLDDLLVSVDSALSSSEITVKEGDKGPIDVHAEVTQKNGKILIVSFGEQEGALRWIKDTNCSYDMVLDPERKIYTAFGLFRSISKVWSISCLMYYVEQMTAGRQLPKPYENIHDDTMQLGGDFILDGTGIVKMLYPSKNSMDRPSINHILSALRTRD